MINDNPLVSVILPSYNHKDYILTAINSVLGQTYKNVELIVIDDGSSDGSIELLKDVSQRLGFLLCCQENSGVSKALNRGIKEFSKGDFVCILASDDYYEPSKIERQLLALKSSNGSEFCYTQAREFSSRNGETLRVFPKRSFNGRVVNSLVFRQPYAAGSMMFSRRLYEKLNGFDEDLQIEDWDFSIRAASLTNFTSVNEPLFNYRSHPVNTMKSIGRRRIFQEKAKTLSKNYMLFNPLRWLLAILLHFLYDHAYSYLRVFDLRRLGG